jgi:hypothetical protein
MLTGNHIYVATKLPGYYVLAQKCIAFDSVQTMYVCNDGQKFEILDMHN